MHAEPVVSRRDAADDYWAIARQPLTCLIFLTPLLILYEAGVLWVGGSQAESLRNGADFWMRGWLRELGAGQPCLLPVFVVCGLLIWQIAGKYPWRVSADAMLGMLAESLLFAFCLVVLGQVQDLAFRQYHMVTAASHAGGLPAGVLPRVISFVGAGVYEEVLFRLCLLPVCYAALRLLLLPGKAAAVLAVICTSVAFSSAHYVGAGADQFSFYTFLFRALAGMFFAVLFILRGFGITAGSHAAYDVLVGVLFESQLP